MLSVECSFDAVANKSVAAWHKFYAQRARVDYIDDSWVDVVPTRINTSAEFACVINDLPDLCYDNTSFIRHKAMILDAYREGNLYGLKLKQPDAVCKKHELLDSISCFEFSCLLPCFCVKEKDTAILIWVHEDIRMMGFGRKLVKMLGITAADTPVPESMGFWNKLNIT